MSKIVFFSIPAHGHTNPTLGVVKELIARGNEVTYYCYEPMREKLEATGAKFIACDKYDPQTKLTPEDGERIGKDLAFSTNLIVDMTLALDDAIISDMRALKPDVIVGDSVAYWGKLIAKKLDIPFVSSTTTFAFNQYSSKTINKGNLGQLFNVIFAMPKINKSLEKLRAKGYDVKNVFSVIGNDNDTDTVVYTAPQFQPCVETFSDKYTFVGASIRDIQEPFERVAQPTIYISLGTVVNLNKNFYRECIKAFADGKYRVILSVGEYTDIASLGEMPSNIICKNRVDQIAALNVADVFLTHCGMNSANEALYFGVPMLLYPQTPEQGAVASQIELLHAGIKLEKADAASIRSAADAVLASSELKQGAKALSDNFHQCGGAAKAADVIEKAALKK